MHILTHLFSYEIFQVETSHQSPPSPLDLLRDASPYNDFCGCNFISVDLNQTTSLAQLSPRLLKVMLKMFFVIRDFSTNS